ncbi:sulfite exporter TauE/SafE family protein [Candidatus Woesearchaeota archaeon]|nr:sulfite exporter TauE/SafE family protein [Candidatus Woesearchaeota archaeon]
MKKEPEIRQLDIFLNSVFFVLGFAIVFSLVGVLLQGLLANVSVTVQAWLGYIGGAIIILFGLYLLRIVKIPFLEREHKLRVKRKFKYAYVTSFIFGAAFAVGWTPCVGAVLGAILTLAVSNPGNAFGLLLAYSLGLGIPFLIVGAFTGKAAAFISKAGKWLTYVNYVFGVLLIVLGVLVFTNKLSRIANLPILTELLLKLDAQTGGLGTLTLPVSFIAGLGSFLSPCVLPLLPAFLSYLAASAIQKS